MRIVLGLGNPGARYTDTRHNIGFILVDYLARRAGAEWVASARDHSVLAEVDWDGQPVLLAKPQTYMNRSGLAARALCARFAVPPGDVLVAYDDFLLDFGRLRVRGRGSDGGAYDNGLRGRGSLHYRRAVQPRRAASALGHWSTASGRRYCRVRAGAFLTERWRSRNAD